MGILDALFSKPDPTIGEVKTVLKKTEIERKRKIIEMRRLEQKKQRLIDDMKAARKESNDFQVDVLWEDLKSHKMDASALKKEIKVLNLEYITLKRYSRGMERLEKRSDKEGMKSLLHRLQASGLDSKLAAQDIDEASYMDELNAILDQTGIQIGDADQFDDYDPEKEKFLAELDAINEAEHAGDYDEAVERESKLRTSLEKEQQDMQDF